MKNILVTGGAGYIGSHVVKKIIEKGGKVIVYDSLVKGHRKAIDKKAVFIKGNLADSGKLNNIFKKHKIDAVIHFAAFIEAGESMKNPGKYFINNVANGINLLNMMVKHEVKKIIYSSSAGVYGNPKKIPIKESEPLNPVNVYGETKALFEKIPGWYDKINGIKFTALRYFNAAGATKDLGEDHDPETHLIPLVLKAAINKKEVRIFGTDYPTKDGTCVRDYIHVEDLANAHILALNNLKKESKIYNLGSEEGYSVREIIETAKKITKKEIKVREVGRRPGDPSILVASSKKIKKELKWKPKLSNINKIIKDAWEWYSNNPKGYMR